MAISIFAVPIFFVVFRETLETAIIVSVLLVFLRQMFDSPSQNIPAYKNLVRQIWLGTAVGLLICLLIGSGLIAAFYTLGNNAWEKYEYIYEGCFAIISSVIISVLGAALLRVSKMEEKWRVKLSKSFENSSTSERGTKATFKHWCEKYVMFIVPFVTIMREGLEAVIFVAGVSFSATATAVPLPVVTGLLAGGFVGWLLYKCGKSSKLQLILVISTALLYLVAAGLFSRAVWFFQQQNWNIAVGGEAAEMGAGPGSYDIEQSVWHINFGSPHINGGGFWGVFNSMLGWQNSATYGSVVSYSCYWLVVIIGFLLMRYKEVHGHLPLRKPKSLNLTRNNGHSERSKIPKLIREKISRVRDSMR
ncbi:Plasma membrane iron permease [Golovinomyces cichoracearum]|uniref:Plasma membrane iron permease n=1 Tax=Golovinomyces cichoracearum TaxID=62708 RepID=A0A420J253_9PEZI|nr:Plasma membrane iron permease [Golovinomyces cichoracearum]